MAAKSPVKASLDNLQYFFHALSQFQFPGGLSSVVHTEVIQAVLLMFGSMVLTYFCFKEVGGWSGMIDGLNALREAGELTKTPDEVVKFSASRG